MPLLLVGEMEQVPHGSMRNVLWAVTSGVGREFSWRMGHLSPICGVEGEGTFRWRGQHQPRLGSLKAI